MQRPFSNQLSSRSVSYGANGMVATSHPLATNTGLEILKSGGTAMDAAISANAMLGVVEPNSCGVGGDLFAIIWDPNEKKLHSLNGSGPLSLTASLQEVKGRGLKYMPLRGGLTVTVPGCVKSWQFLHKRFGKLELSQIFKSPIEYAESGFVVTDVIAGYWEEELKSLDRFQEFVDLYTDKGRPPQSGEIFKNRNLAMLYSGFVDNGLDSFYKGAIADEIIKKVRKYDGFMEPKDLLDYEPEWLDASSTNYRGRDIWEIGQNNQGLTVLQMLNIIENHDLSKFKGPTDPGYLHLLIEAKKLAFEDRANFYIDPRFSEISLDEILSKEYAAKQYKKIHPNKVLNLSPAQRDTNLAGDTVYLTVADQHGMMVSLIQSNYRGFGSGVVVDKYGFGLQSRGELFSLNDQHANVLYPGKRPFHTIIPGFVTQHDCPLMSFGVMGADMQPQGHVQVLINQFDFGMDIQLAGDVPRVRHEGSSTPKGHTVSNSGFVYCEFSMPKESIAGLSAIGHDVKVTNDGLYGGYQAILRNLNTGVYSGATEPRKDGCALGY
jgi:gamma-glutamyltranspeptidase / glutathione hydrolase